MDHVACQRSQNVHIWSLVSKYSNSVIWNPGPSPKRHSGMHPGLSSNRLHLTEISNQMSYIVDDCICDLWNMEISKHYQITDSLLTLCWVKMEGSSNNSPSKTASIPGNIIITWPSEMCNTRTHMSSVICAKSSTSNLKKQHPRIHRVQLQFLPVVFS